LGSVVSPSAFISIRLRPDAPPFDQTQLLGDPSGTAPLSILRLFHSHLEFFFVPLGPTHLFPLSIVGLEVSFPPLPYHRGLNRPIDFFLKLSGRLEKGLMIPTNCSCFQTGLPSRKCAFFSFRAWVFFGVLFIEGFAPCFVPVFDEPFAFYILLFFFRRIIGGRGRPT